jgi:hypothetical protein
MTIQPYDNLIKLSEDKKFRVRNAWFAGLRRRPITETQLLGELSAFGFDRDRLEFIIDDTMDLHTQVNMPEVGDDLGTCGYCGEKELEDYILLTLDHELGILLCLCDMACLRMWDHAEKFHGKNPQLRNGHARA